MPNDHKPWPHTWLHWRLEREASGLAVATLDRAGSSTNTLSVVVLQEFAQLLDVLEQLPPTGLLIRSGKTTGFIAGADVGEFAGLSTPTEARALVERGWSLFGRLSRLPFPSLALVRGHCLGGGLELALACRYILAVDEPGTRFGLPEVMLGIFPGWGGMARLPQRVGPSIGLDLMLTGRTLSAASAKKIGLVDVLVPARVMELAARQCLLSGTVRRPLPWMQACLNGPLRFLVAAQAKKRLARKARPEHYPAPYAIIDWWAHHGGNPLAAPALLEQIMASTTARHLLRVFRLQERLKDFGKHSDFLAQRVHVIGAGVMGGDIAAWCALRGCTVTLQDPSPERTAQAVQRAFLLFEKRLRDPLRVRAAGDRLLPDPAGHGVAQADVVIEAIVEHLATKQALLQALEPRMRPGALLASNTSSLRLEDLGAVLQHPQRLVGIHFFNPVPRMPLVEVVCGPETGAQVVQDACAFVRQIDKWPLPVRSAPGFLVNAVLAPYMLAALQAVDEGLAPETVDAALLAFGMPMGPIELADTVGLDVVAAAGQQLVPGAAVPACLQQRLDKGQLGKKSGQGFYDWATGRAKKGRSGPVPPGLAQGLIGVLCQRTAALVADGVVADADLADAGVIFGTGFAPFTGGPLHWQRGLAEGTVQKI